MLCPTPPEFLCDARGRPYFLWDTDLTLAEWRARLDDDDDDVRAYWLAAAMRQAKPDDVLSLVGWGPIESLWPRLRGRLGQREAFWNWRMDWRRRHGR